MVLKCVVTKLVLSTSMPAAPRFNKKAQKIAFSILGTPANMQSGKKAYRIKTDKVIDYQNTARIR